MDGPVGGHVQPLGHLDGDKVLPVRSLEVVRRRPAVVPGVEEVVGGQDGGVRVPDDEDGPPAKVPGHVSRAGVVGLLRRGRPVPPVADLAPEAEHLQLQVLVPGPGEDAPGPFQQVPDPRVPAAWVAGQGDGRAAVRHQVAGPVVGAVGVVGPRAPGVQGGRQNEGGGIAGQRAEDNEQMGGGDSPFFFFAGAAIVLSRIVSCVDHFDIVVQPSRLLCPPQQHCRRRRRHHQQRCRQ